MHRIELDDYPDFARFISGVEDGTWTTWTLGVLEGLAEAAVEAVE